MNRLGTSPSEELPAQRTPTMTLDSFVRSTRTTIKDVVLAASVDMHRVELTRDGTPRFTVTVPRRARDEGATESEALALSRLARVLPPALARTIPSPVDVVEIGGRRCLVLTALPGEVLKPVTVPSTQAWDGTVDTQFLAVLRWLQQLWSCTRSTGRAPSDPTLVPRLAARLSRDQRWPRLEAVLLTAIGRLAEVPVPGTVVHGALSPHAVRLGPAGVTGVGDWSRASLCGDARRDIGRFVVAYAPDHVDTALHARTRYASAVRSFVTGALASLGADEDSWRETVVLGLAEAAASEDRGLSGAAAAELLALASGASWNAAPLRGRGRA